MDDRGNGGGRTLNTQAMQDRLKGDSFPDNWDDFLDDDIRAFFDELLEQTGWRKSDVIREANISRAYGYQIMEGRRFGKRDYYLCIALAMSLDLKTAQRMLAVTKNGALHPLIKRGAVVKFSLRELRYSNKGSGIRARRKRPCRKLRRKPMAPINSARE